MKSQSFLLQVLGECLQAPPPMSPSPHTQNPSNRFIARHPRFNNSRRSGVALVYAVGGLVMFLGTTALVVDMGSLYTRRAQAQRAADAAALAGAWDLQEGSDGSVARATAREYARLNGYDNRTDADGDMASKVDVQITTGPGSTTPNNRVEVLVQKRENLYFLPAVRAILGLFRNDRLQDKKLLVSTIGAHAVAETVFASQDVNLDITGDEYGSADGVANPSVFGPDALYEYGDAFSPRTTNGTDPNPGRDSVEGGDKFPGYTYNFTIPTDYRTRNGTSNVQMEIFDPDCYVTNPNDSIASWDELHNGNGSNNTPTVTKYTLKSPNGTIVAEATYGGDPNNPKDVDGNLKWTTPDGFAFNIDDPNRGTGVYTVTVKSLSGVSENGFQFRAGPTRSDPNSLRTQADYNTWRTQYDAGGRANGATGNGTAFSAKGKNVFNFTRSGIVKVKLGFVPGNVKGGQIFVDKFDTDVGAKSIAYSYVRGDNGQEIGIAKPGTLASNGTWGATDAISVDLPNGASSDVTNYPDSGGVWYATYEAAAYDTSTWKISYSGIDRNTPKVRLVD